MSIVQCAVPDQHMAASRLLTCVADIKTLMSSNWLKLNDGKTEFIWLGIRQQLAKISSASLQLKGQSIMPRDKVRDLGIITDSEPSVGVHAQNVVHVCFYELQQLSLPMNVHYTMVVAFIAGRVDYCNGVLYSMLAQVIRSLQIVLNAAACLVVGAGKYQHITTVLRDMLDWLPACQ